VQAWFLRFLWRYFRFFGSLGAAGASAAWIFGEDLAAREYLSQNRGITAILIVLSIISYAMYDWLDQPPEE
jgi:hypothetical protein